MSTGAFSGCLLAATPLDVMVTIKSPRLPPGTTGIVRFAGVIDETAGEWVGIELRTPTGTNDGMAAINGKRYFQCSPNHGLFCRPWLVQVEKRTSTLTANTPSNESLSLVEQVTIEDVQKFILTRVENVEELDDIDTAVQARQKQLRSRKMLEEENALLRRAKRRPAFAGVNKVVGELVKKGKSFCHESNAILLMKKDMIKDGGGGREMVKCLFGNVEMLKEVCQHMHEELVADAESVGSILYRYAPFVVHLYGQYGANYQDQIFEKAALRSTFLEENKISPSAFERVCTTHLPAPHDFEGFLRFLRLPLHHVSAFERVVKKLLHEHKKIPATVKGVRSEIVLLTKSLRLVQLFLKSAITHVVGEDNDMSKTVASPKERLKNRDLKSPLKLHLNSKSEDTTSPMKLPCSPTTPPSAPFVQASWPEVPKIPPPLEPESNRTTKRLKAHCKSSGSPLLKLATRTLANANLSSKNVPFYSRVSSSASSPVRVFPPRTPPYLRRELNKNGSPKKQTSLVKSPFTLKRPVSPTKTLCESTALRKSASNSSLISELSSPKINGLDRGKPSEISPKKENRRLNNGAALVKTPRSSFTRTPLKSTARKCGKGNVGNARSAQKNVGSIKSPFDALVSKKGKVQRSPVAAVYGNTKPFRTATARKKNIPIRKLKKKKSEPSSAVKAAAAFLKRTSVNAKGKKDFSVGNKKYDQRIRKAYGTAFKTHGPLTFARPVPAFKAPLPKSGWEKKAFEKYKSRMSDARTLSKLK